MGKMNRPCAVKSCPNPAIDGSLYCIEHQSLVKRQYKRYNEIRTDRDIQKFYHSSRWNRLRQWKLNQNPICEICGAPAEIVDHIIPIREGGDPMSVDNLQSLCKACHNKKHFGKP